MSERGQESKGAMKNYLKKSEEIKSSTQSAWGDLIGTVKATEPAPRRSNVEESSSSGRVMNERFDMRKRGKRPTGAPPPAPAAGPRFDGEKGIAQVFGRKGEGRGDRDDPDAFVRDDEDVPPEILAYLDDTTFFDQKVSEGMQMDFSDMDPVDKFMADAFYVSYLLY